MVWRSTIDSTAAIARTTATPPSHGPADRESGWTTRDSGRADARATRAAEERDGQHEPGHEQGDRLPRGQGVADQGARDSEPQAPQCQHHGAGDRADQVPRRCPAATAMPSYHLRPRNRRRSTCALVASEPLAHRRTATRTPSRASQGYAAATPRVERPRPAARRAGVTDAGTRLGRRWGAPVLERDVSAGSSCSAGGSASPADAPGPEG